MKLATRAGRVVPSPTLSLTATAKAMAAQGIDVVDFASGEPDFDTPDPVKAAAEAAIRDGFTKYTAAGGIPELKAAIVEKLARDQGLQYEPGQVLVSCGAKHSLYNFCEAFLQAGDEVLVPAPFWVSYQDQIVLNDATPVIVPTREADGYAVTRQQLESHLTPRTKAIIINSPSNPTGAVYSRQTLEDIARVAIAKDLLVVSDEIYEKIIYDGQPHVSITAVVPEVVERTLIVNGVSKAYAMTGWRIGYVAGPKPLVTAMTNIQSQSTSNPCSISQKAALAALRGGDAFPRQMVQEFDRRRRYMVERLTKMPGLRCPLPAGAFYAFPNVEGLFGRRHDKGTLQSAGDVAGYLLDAAKVVTVPGEPFGSGANIRLSYATSMEAIERGMDRMEDAIRRLS